MCKFITRSDERILCKLSKCEILRLYSIVHVAMETTKTSNFACESKSFISIFFTCQVSVCELQPFSCYDLANDIHLQTAKTVFSHLNNLHSFVEVFFTSFRFIFAACLVRSIWFIFIIDNDYLVKGLRRFKRATKHKESSQLKQSQQESSDYALLWCSPEQRQLPCHSEEYDFLPSNVWDF